MDDLSGRRVQVCCHQCEDEWYRDEHGLICPQCHSSSTEVIETGHDPRTDISLDGAHRTLEHNGVPHPDENNKTDTRWQSPLESYSTYPTLGLQQTYQEGRENALPSSSSIPASIRPTLESIRDGRQPGSTTNTDLQGDVEYHSRSDTGPPSSPGRRDQEASPGAFVRRGDRPGLSWPAHTETSTGRIHSPQRASRAGPSDLAMPTDALMRAVSNTAHNIRMTALLLLLLSSHHGLLLLQLLSDPRYNAQGPNPSMASSEANGRGMRQLIEQYTIGNAPDPAPTEVLESLPRRTITKKDLGPENQAECSICLHEVHLGDEVTDLPCHHWFHDVCVKTWLTKHDTCPHRRQGTTPRDEFACNARVREYDEAPQHAQMWGQQRMEGSGTQEDPWVVPEAPQAPRHTNAPGLSRHASGASSRSSRSSGGSSNERLFNRVRSALDGGGNGQGQ